MVDPIGVACVLVGWTLMSLPLAIIVGRAFAVGSQAFGASLDVPADEHRPRDGDALGSRRFADGRAVEISPFHDRSNAL